MALDLQVRDVFRRPTDSTQKRDPYQGPIGISMGMGVFLLLGVGILLDQVDIVGAMCVLLFFYCSSRHLHDLIMFCE